MWSADLSIHWEILRSRCVCASRFPLGLLISERRFVHLLTLFRASAASNLSIQQLQFRIDEHDRLFGFLKYRMIRILWVEQMTNPAGAKLTLSYDADCQFTGILIFEDEIKGECSRRNSSYKPSLLAFILTYLTVQVAAHPIHYSINTSASSASDPLPCTSPGTTFP